MPITGDAAVTRAHAAPALSAANEETPSVGVVIATHNRPELMRLALQSVLRQEFAGGIHVVIVHDDCPVDHSLTSETPNRKVTVLENDRTRGLAGSRNCGILHLRTTLVAFCDDDDTWHPNKLREQLLALSSEPDAEFSSTAMEVRYDNRVNARLAGKSVVGYSDFVQSRMAMVHSSSFLVRRSALTGPIGLVDETIPNSMCEDWDLLLRASRRHPIVHVDKPLISVLWGGTSYFNQKWEIKNRAHLWMLDHYPDILANDIGAGRVYGQLGFGYAAVGNRKKSLTWIGMALRRNWREPRAYLALLVTIKVFSAGRVMHILQRFGHGV